MLPELPRVGQMVNFLHVHDELTLEGLTEQEWEEVFAAFAPEPTMQIYQRGIRRRVASMLGGDRRRLELAYSLTFSLPGTPTLLYGDEIGMGEDLPLPGRLSVRTAMQWANKANGGFSTASSDALVRPVISSGPFGYQKVNVVDQRRDAGSFLNWMERAIRARRESLAIGLGDLRILHVDDDRIFAHACESQGETSIAVHNLSADRLTVTIDTEEIEINSLVEIFNDQSYGLAVSTIKPCHLSPYGYRWFQAAGIVR